MYCTHFVTRMKEGNLLLVKILEGFFLYNNQIMLYTNTVEVEKDWIIHLASREAARSEMSGKNRRKESTDEMCAVRCTEL